MLLSVTCYLLLIPLQMVLMVLLILTCSLPVILLIIGVRVLKRRVGNPIIPIMVISVTLLSPRLHL